MAEEGAAVECYALIHIQPGGGGSLGFPSSPRSDRSIDFNPPIICSGAGFAYAFPANIHTQERVITTGG